MFVFGYQNVGATTDAVIVGANCGPIIRDVRIWFGHNGLNNQGVDGVVENANICGYNDAVFSTGANCYSRDKLGTCGITSVSAFEQGTTCCSLSVAENHFIESDFSGSYTNSVRINDGVGTKAITTFDGSVFSNLDQ